MKNTQPTDGTQREDDPVCEQYQVSDLEPITLGEAVKRARDRYDVDVTRYGAEVLLTGGTEYVDVFDAAEFDRACAEVMVGPFDSFYDTLREHCADLIETNHARAAAAVARFKAETGCDLRID